MILRGEVWWAHLPEPRGSEPGYRHPVLVVQSNTFNRSSIQTTLVAVLTSNLTLARAPGNVHLTRRETGLSRDSVVNVSRLMTVDKKYLSERVGRLSAAVMSDVDAGLRRVLSL